MCARAGLPAAGVHLWTTIAEGFGVARRNERGERAPDSGFSEKRTVFEITMLADAVENEADVVSTVSPDFAQPAKCETGRFVKTHRRPDSDMRYGVPRAVGFAENVGVTVVCAWFPVLAQASEHGGAAFALVEPFAERVMHAIGDGDRPCDARRNGTQDGEARDGLRR